MSSGWLVPTTNEWQESVYPDFLQSSRTKRTPFHSIYLSEVTIVPPTADMYTGSIFATDYPDVVPTFKHRIYLHPTEFKTSNHFMTFAQSVMEWQPEYPDYLRPNRRSAYWAPFDPDFLHDVRAEPSAAMLASIFGTTWPDFFAKVRRLAYMVPASTSSLRAPGSLWTEPAITAISGSFTEPAITAVSTTWTEPAITEVTTTWTEPAQTPTTEEDE